MRRRRPIGHNGKSGRMEVGNRNLIAGHGRKSIQHRRSACVDHLVGRRTASNKRGLQSWSNEWAGFIQDRLQSRGGTCDMICQTHVSLKEGIDSMRSRQYGA